MKQWALVIALFVVPASAGATGSSPSGVATGARAIRRVAGALRTRPAIRAARSARQPSQAWQAAAGDARATVRPLRALLRRPEVAHAAALSPAGMSSWALVGYRSVIMRSLRNHRSVATLRWLTRVVEHERVTLERAIDPGVRPTGTHDEVYAAARATIDAADAVLRDFEPGPALSPRGRVYGVARGYRSQLQQSLNNGRAVKTVADLEHALRTVAADLRDAPAP